jgi:hypothetical protein
LLLLLSIPLVSAFTSSCSTIQMPPKPEPTGGSPHSRNLPTGYEPAQIQFPPMSTAPPTARLVNSSVEVELAGNEYVDSSGGLNYVPSGTSDYVIVSGAEGTQAWAVYGLAGLTDQRPVGLELNVKSAAQQPEDRTCFHCSIGAVATTPDTAGNGGGR